MWFTVKRILCLLKYDNRQLFIYWVKLGKLGLCLSFSVNIYLLYYKLICDLQKLITCLTVLVIFIFQYYSSSLIILYNIKIFVLLESLFDWSLFTIVQLLYGLCLQFGILNIGWIQYYLCLWPYSDSRDFLSPLSLVAFYCRS